MVQPSLGPPSDRSRQELHGWTDTQTPYSQVKTWTQNCKTQENSSTQDNKYKISGWGGPALKAPITNNAVSAFPPPLLESSDLSDVWLIRARVSRTGEQIRIHPLRAAWRCKHYRHFTASESRLPMARLSRDFHAHRRRHSNLAFQHILWEISRRLDRQDYIREDLRWPRVRARRDKTGNGSLKSRCFRGPTSKTEWH